MYEKNLSKNKNIKVNYSEKFCSFAQMLWELTEIGQMLRDKNHKFIPPVTSILLKSS